MVKRPAGRRLKNRKLNTLLPANFVPETLVIKEREHGDLCNVGEGPSDSLTFAVALLFLVFKNCQLRALKLKASKPKVTH